LGCVFSILSCWSVFDAVLNKPIWNIQSKSLFLSIFLFKYICITYHFDTLINYQQYRISANERNLLWSVQVCRCNMQPITLFFENPLMCTFCTELKSCHFNIRNDLSQARTVMLYDYYNFYCKQMHNLVSVSRPTFNCVMTLSCVNI
jgi:hypothetical protein